MTDLLKPQATTPAARRKDHRGLTHLSRFEVVHYRGLDGFTLQKVAPVNLITGVNGVGKTALLEGLWLFHGRHNASLLWNANVLRRTAGAVADPVSELTRAGAIEMRGSENGSEHTFQTHMERPDPSPGADRAPPGGEPQGLPVPLVARQRTVLDGREANGALHIVATPEGQVARSGAAPPSRRPTGVLQGATREVSLTDEELEWFSDIVRAGHRDEIARVLRLVAPEASDLQVLIDRSRKPYLSVLLPDGDDRPIQDMGAGFARLCRLVFGGFTARGGILLVDEIENGLHHSILPSLWKHLRTLIQQWSVQLFVTTHSAECLDAAMEAFEDRPTDLAVHSLYRRAKNGTTGAATYTGDALTGAQSLDLELR